MAPWLPRRRAAGARPRRLSGWTAVVPVAAAVAGLLFATSAQTAKGTDLRATGRTDLVGRDPQPDVRGRAPGRARSSACRPRSTQLTARSSPGSAAVARLRSQADRLAPLVGTEPGQRARAAGHPRRRQAHRPRACPTASPPTTSWCTSRTCRAWSTRCGPAAPRR